MQRLPQSPPRHGAEGQLLDRVEAVLDALQLHQRAQDPLPEQPGPHGGARLVEHVEQGAPAASVGHALHELEVAAGEPVDHEHVLPAAGQKAGDVGQVTLLGLPHQFLEAGLVDSGLAGAEPRHLRLVDVDADHLVAELGQADRGRQPDVARADDRDCTHCSAECNEGSLRILAL